MARDKHDAPEDLAVEIAKLKLRVAAEKAEPGRLLKRGIRSSPLPSVAGALGAGTLLAILRGKGGAAAKTRMGRESGVGALVMALAAQAAIKYLPELLGQVQANDPDRNDPDSAGSRGPV